MNKKNTTVAIAYIPVLHKGYVSFLEEIERQNVIKLYVVGDSILAAHRELDYINRKDRIRALGAKSMQAPLAVLFDGDVQVLEKDDVAGIQKEGKQLLMPNEDVSRFIAATFFKSIPVSYVDIFLRWHRDNVDIEKEIEEKATITKDKFHKEIMRQAVEESSKSFDWWRQVGAALIKDGETISIAHNEHMPDEQYPNVFGDPRALAKQGIAIHITTAAHAEGALIADAAKSGISLEGAELYVTDFPCPFCARMIAKSGIKKVFFQKGYASLEGDTFLEDAGVEIVRVV